MRDLVLGEPGLPLICAICGIERGGADPPGPWFRHRPSHRRRVPIYKADGWAVTVPLGYLEYIKTMKIALDNGGSYLEPDDGPRNTKFHMRIVRIEAIPGTQSGHQLFLECGHGVQAFGNLGHAKGVVLCTKCRDLEEQ